ncbi:BTAD domain-containing putative transcriptional regulator, partial [Micromonospora chersina]|uniref:AfsR/SARP family transcriptional regulator n=1 Tax=Micromonospora chersina TaxID=47854 RepID=UPI003712EAB2
MEEIGVLGPLMVRVGDAEVDVPSRRQRALLTRLLLEPGTIISVGALADAAWGDGTVPRDVRSALQVQISRLRTLLGPAGALITTRAPGYRLDIPPERIDAHCFESRIHESRELARWAPDRALASLEKALALWRGPAYAEFADSFARAEALRLEQLRRRALEDRAAALIAVGRWNIAVAETEALIAAEPLREPTYALAMRALVGAGRRSDALALYQRLRLLLVEEFGSEPSAELQSLHVAILRADDDLGTLTVPGAAATGSLLPSPRSAPVPVNAFFGREAELRSLADAASRSRLTTLTGPGGVGKTRLSKEWLFRSASGRPAVWVELASLADPQGVPSALLDALDLPAPARVAPLDALVMTLRTRSVLLVLDNCEHLLDAVARTVDTVIGACPHVRVLATSRERLGVDGERVVVLPPLAVDVHDSRGADGAPAVDLFLDRVRSAGYPIDEHDPHVRGLAQAICWRLDGLPLALELTAAHAASLGLAAVAEATDLLGLASGRRSQRLSHRSLRATLDWSHNLLSDDEQRLLRRLSVFPSRIPVSWAAAVCSGRDLAAQDIPVLLARLVDRCLLTAGHDGHEMLQTVRRYAGERLV